jgi:gliding motility-associated-like protein
MSSMYPYSAMLNYSADADSYIWDFGDGSGSFTDVNPTHVFPDSDSGTYTITLIANNSYNCADTTQTRVIVNEELVYYIPNTFTPDRDQYNETFKAVFTSGYDPYDFTMLIFDRWGELVFESHDADVGWNGKYGENGDGFQVQDGTFTWKIDFKMKTGNVKKTIVGHVNILR